MRTTTTGILIAGICAIVAMPIAAGPKWGPERLDAPEWEIITQRLDYMFFNWTTVYLDEAETMAAPKYSLDILAKITYFDEVELVRKVAYVQLSFGTSDRTDGRDMSDSDLAIHKDDLRAAVIDEMGLTEVEVGPMLLEGAAKVKALNPGKDKGPQNNPFSPSQRFSILL